jgi:hypothetical protein
MPASPLHTAFFIHPALTLYSLGFSHGKKDASSEGNPFDFV